MTTLTFLDLLRTSALVTLLLLLKFIAVTARWAIAKARAGLRAPEDPQSFPNPPSPQQLATAERARLVVFNDLESIPVGLVIVWASAVCVGYTLVSGVGGGGLDDESVNLVRAHVGLTVIFCVARFVHSAVYSVGGPARLRSFAFTVGLASVLALNVVAIVAVFRSQPATYQPVL